MAEAVIIEDDVVALPFFFRFCQELLVKYRNDDNATHTKGDSMFTFERQELQFPLAHPEKIERDARYDAIALKQIEKELMELLQG